MLLKIVVKSLAGIPDMDLRMSFWSLETILGNLRLQLIFNAIELQLFHINADAQSLAFRICVRPQY